MGFRPFSFGQFGRTPSVPEYECSGDFSEDLCKWCDDYEKCRDAEYIDCWDKLEKESEDD